MSRVRSSRFTCDSASGLRGFRAPLVLGLTILALMIALAAAALHTAVESGHDAAVCEVCLATDRNHGLLPLAVSALMGVALPVLSRLRPLPVARRVTCPCPPAWSRGPPDPA
ncbi:MAG: hypothetical protein ACFB22_12480 [Rhodothalassiaceae bacterium]